MSNDNENARNQARAQFESIKEMVAALNLDWDRLEELREEKVRLLRNWEDSRQELEEKEKEFGDKLFPHEDSCATQQDWEGVEPFCNCELGSLRGELENSEDALNEWNDAYEEELSELEAEAGDCANKEDAEQRIQEDPLSVQVRSDWHDPGGDSEASEFQILLCTGGPAVKIEGKLGQWNQPESAEIFYQDWFTPWSPLGLTHKEQEIVLEYCHCFYFGE